MMMEEKNETSGLIQTSEAAKITKLYGSNSIPDLEQMMRREGGITDASVLSLSTKLFKSQSKFTIADLTGLSNTPSTSSLVPVVSTPQLNLLPLMQQWSMAAAARHATLLNSTTAGSYFPFSLLSSFHSMGAPTTSLLSPSAALNLSSLGGLGQSMFPSSSESTSPSSELALPSRRQSNPFKPPPVKKYKCDECGKSFSRSNTLVTHKRIHTGEKPFKCDNCGRAFRQPGNLTRHKLTHTTIKPYVCPTCGKAFNRASNLHTHMRTHSTFRPFICHLCGKMFQQKIDLKVHYYTHTGIYGGLEVTQNI